MGLLSFLFGKNKSKEKEASVKPAGAGAQVGKDTSNKAKPSSRDYKTPDRTFVSLAEDMDAEGFTLAGVARIDILLLMGRVTGDDKPYSYVNVMYEALVDSGVISVHLVVEKDNQKYGVFAFYSEIEAANFKLFRSLLMEQGGFTDCYYTSAFDPEKYEIEDGELEKGTSFHAVFKAEENPELAEFENRYAIWWSADDDPMIATSPTLDYLKEMYTAVHGYETYFCGMLIAGMYNKEFGRLALPEEEKVLYTTGPENKKVLIALSQEKGIRVLLPRDEVDATYRHRLLKLMSKSMLFLRKGLEERQVPKDELNEVNGLDWFTLMESSVRKEGSVVESIGGFTVGDPEVPEEDAQIKHEKVLIRIKAGQIPTDFELGTGESFQLSRDQQPFFQPFQEDFVLGLVQDIGHSYTFISNQLLSAYEGNVADLIAYGKGNVLREIKGNIKMVGDPTTGPIMITCGGNHESALIVFDEFWAQIGETIQSDFCMVLPVRDILIVCNFYHPDCMELLRKEIRKFYYKEGAFGVMSNNIYLRKDSQWKILEEVGPES